MGIVINSADTAVAARAADKARERNNMVMRRDWCMLFQVLRVDTSDYCTSLPCVCSFCVFDTKREMNEGPN